MIAATNEERNSRNIKAWAYNDDLVSQFSMEFEKRNKGRSIDKKTLETELQTELEARLAPLGRQRQEMLYNTRVMLIGSDILGQMIATGLAGIGVGNYCIIGNTRTDSGIRNDLYCPKNAIKMQIRKQSLAKIDHVKKALKEIYNHANISIINSVFSDICKKTLEKFNPEVVIDATNDSYSKKRAIQYAIYETKKLIPIISVASNNHMSVMSAFWSNGEDKPDLEKLLHTQFDGMEQGAYPSGMIAALTIDEVRKFKFQYSNIDRNIRNNHQIIFNAYATSRNTIACDLKKDFLNYYRNNRVLVAGVGAIGNMVSLEVTLHGIGRVDLLDYDMIEEGNVPNQPLLRAGTGRKCEIAAKRLKELREDADIRPIYGKIGHPDIFQKEFLACHGTNFSLTDGEQQNQVELITEEKLRKGRYDIIFGCFDNRYARMWLNEFAVRNKIPYIDGGSQPRGGSVLTYIPGKTKCIDCQRNLEKFPPKTSCQINPSTIIPNMAVASDMVAEGLQIINQGLNPSYVPPVFEYSPYEPQRFMFVESSARRDDHPC